MSKPVHIKKFGTRTGETPQEMHRRLAFRGRRCNDCDRPAVIRIKVLAPLKELLIRPETRQIVMAIAASNPVQPGTVPVVPTTYGQMVKTSDQFFCGLCAVGAEKRAAHMPSWAIVEIDRGPNPTNRITVGSA